MKYFAATIVALASVATAQLSNIPSCALSCFLGPLGSDGCKDLTDFKCHCQKAESLFAAVIPCAQKSCSAEDQAATIAAVEKTCADAGVPISVPDSAAPSSSAAPVSTPAPSSTPVETPSSEAMASTEAPAASSSAASIASVLSSVASSLASEASSAAASASMTPTMNSTSSSTPTSTVSEFTGGAAQATKAAGLLGAAALALLAL